VSAEDLGGNGFHRLPRWFPAELQFGWRRRGVEPGLEVKDARLHLDRLAQRDFLRVDLQLEIAIGCRIECIRAGPEKIDVSVVEPANKGLYAAWERVNGKLVCRWLRYPD
jgi:hypothetical protein